MLSHDRKSKILEIAQSEGTLRVEDLAQRLGVADQTIRRDLSHLAKSGQIQRVHGGAVLTSTARNLDYDRRRNRNIEGKRRIGQACARLINNGSSVFMNIGTTAEAVAAEMMGHSDLLVVTNSLNTANILAVNPNIEILVAGGTLRRTDGGLLGNMTAQFLELFKFDHAVISCAGIDDDGDLLDFDLQEVHATQSILRQASAVHVVADNTKVRRRAPGKISNLSKVDTWVTDAPLPEDLSTLCRETDTHVIVAGAA